MNADSASAEVWKVGGVDEALEVVLQLVGALVTIARMPGESAEQDRLESFGVIGSHVARRRVVRRAHHFQRLEIGSALEKATARRQLVERRADREHVGARVERLPERLLGRHVRYLPLDAAGAGLIGELHATLRDAEIDELHVAGERNEHVVRRDVAVHDPEMIAREVALRVGVGQSRAESDGHRQRVLDRECARTLLELALDRPKVLAVHVFHGDEVRAVDLPDVVDLHDVRV